MVDGEKQGLGEVLAEAVAGNPVSVVPVQPSLLDDDPDAVGCSPFDQELDRLAGMRSQPRRGRGRPAGAKNRRTEEWAALVLGSRRSPLLVMADFYSMPVEELASRLQCDRLEAAKLQLTAARELAPYVHQKLPTAVALTNDGALPTLILNVAAGAVSGGTVSADTGVKSVLPPIEFIEQNQCVIENGFSEFNAQEFNALSQVVDNNNETTNQPAD